MRKIDRKAMLTLHILLLVYSLGSVCSKAASAQEFLSSKFFLLYGLLLVVMAVYAVFWQQILKRLPLVTAYANKAVTVAWGILWGALLFGEKISVSKIVGAGIIIGGVYLVVSGDESKENAQV